MNGCVDNGSQPNSNAGREWLPKGEPETVEIHDFVDEELGKAIPYGVYDLTRNEGWVSVGIDHDTAQFSVQAIGRWWKEMGLPSYPDAIECSSLPTAVAAIAAVGACGRKRCKTWLQRRVCLSTRVIFRRERTSGTRSSTACFRISPRCVKAVTDADVAMVCRYFVDPIRNRLANRILRPVVYQHRLDRLAPRATSILEVTDQFFFSCPH
jgi:hypothetical protein